MKWPEISELAAKTAVGSEDSQRKKRRLRRSPDPQEAAAHSELPDLPVVNLYDKLNKLKREDVSPQDYLRPVVRNEEAAKAASTMRGLLTARRRALMSTRLAQADAAVVSPPILALGSQPVARLISVSSPPTVGKQSSSGSRRELKPPLKKLKTSDSGSRSRPASIPPDSTPNGSPSSASRKRRQADANLESALPLAFDDQNATTAYDYYKAPKVERVPWFRFLCRRQADGMENITLRKGHREARARLEWDITSSPPSKEALVEFYKSLNFFERLHEEVLAFITWAELTQWESRKRLEILARVTLISQILWDQCEILPFGSFYTGLSLPDGDVDICILNGQPHRRSADLITELVKALRKCQFTKNLIAITRARIPIAKFVDESSGIQVDLSVNQPSAADTSDLTRDKLVVFPVLRPMIMVLKKLLTQLGLNETYQGGIGSYMLFTMCLAHVQAEIRRSGSHFLREANLGHLVYGFLERYTTFNYYFSGIDVRDKGCFFDKKEMASTLTDRDFPPPLLCIRSPLEPQLDVGKNSYKFPEVIDRFKWRLDRLDSILDAEAKLEAAANDPLALSHLREGSVLATLIKPDEGSIANRVLDRRHPNQTNFSVFLSKTTPRVYPALLQDMGRDMQSHLERLAHALREPDSWRDAVRPPRSLSSMPDLNRGLDLGRNRYRAVNNENHRTVYYTEDRLRELNGGGGDENSGQQRRRARADSNYSSRRTRPRSEPPEVVEVGDDDVVEILPRPRPAVRPPPHPPGNPPPTLPPLKDKFVQHLQETLVRTVERW